MQIVNADVLVAAVRRHRDAESALKAWRDIAEDAHWHNLTDVRQTYPSADGVVVASGAVVIVFNIRGNNYRLLTWVSYRAQIVQVIELLTHAEYDKDKWKRRL